MCGKELFFRNFLLITINSNRDKARLVWNLKTIEEDIYWKIGSKTVLYERRYFGMENDHKTQEKKASI